MPNRRVVDGDTIRRDGLASGYGRATGYDAFELNQPGGQAARQELERTIDWDRVQPKGTDRFGRQLVDLFTTDGRPMGEHMIEGGMAIPTRWSSPAEIRAETTSMARSAGHGLNHEDPETTRRREEVRQMWAQAGVPGPGTTTLAVPPDRSGTFKKGVRRGNLGVKAGAYAVSNLLGEIIGSEDLQEWGLQGFERATAEAMRFAPEVGSFQNIKGAGDAWTYVVETLGEQLPILATIFASGGIGAAGGAGVATAASRNAMALAAGKRLIEKHGAAEAKRRIAALGARHAQMSGNKALASKIGAGVGVQQSAGALEMGELQGTFIEAGVSAPGTAVLAGQISGAVGTVMPAYIYGRLFDRITSEMTRGLSTQALSRIVMTELARSAGKGGVIETFANPAQEIVRGVAQTMADPNWDMFGEEERVQMFVRLVDAALKGGIVGTIAGAPGGAVQGLRLGTAAQQAAAPPSVQSRAPSPKGAPEEVVEPETGTVRETPENLIRQIQEHQAGTRAPVFIPGGISSYGEAVATAARPMTRVAALGGTIVATSEAMPRVREILRDTSMTDEAKLAAILDYVQPKDQIVGEAEVVRTVSEGQVVHEQAVAPEAVPEAAAVEEGVAERIREAGREAIVERTTPEQAVAERISTPDPQKPVQEARKKAAQVAGKKLAPVKKKAKTAKKARKASPQVELPLQPPSEQQTQPRSEPLTKKTTTKKTTTKKTTSKKAATKKAATKKVEPKKAEPKKAEPKKAAPASQPVTLPTVDLEAPANSPLQKLAEAWGAKLVGEPQPAPATASDPVTATPRSQLEDARQVLRQVDAQLRLAEGRVRLANKRGQAEKAALAARQRDALREWKNAAERRVNQMSARVDSEPAPMSRATARARTRATPGSAVRVETNVEPRAISRSPAHASGAPLVGIDAEGRSVAQRVPEGPTEAGADSATLAEAQARMRQANAEWKAAKKGPTRAAAQKRFADAAREVRDIKNRIRERTGTPETKRGRSTPRQLTMQQVDAQIRRAEGRIKVAKKRGEPEEVVRATRERDALQAWKDKQAAAPSPATTQARRFRRGQNEAEYSGARTRLKTQRRVEKAQKDLDEQTGKTEQRRQTRFESTKRALSRQGPLRGMAKKAGDQVTRSLGRRPRAPKEVEQENLARLQQFASGRSDPVKQPAFYIKEQHEAGRSVIELAKEFGRDFAKLKALAELVGQWPKKALEPYKTLKSLQARIIEVYGDSQIIKDWVVRGIEDFGPVLGGIMTDSGWVPLSDSTAEPSQVTIFNPNTYRILEGMNFEGVVLHKRAIKGARAEMHATIESTKEDIHKILPLLIDALDDAKMSRTAIMHLKAMPDATGTFLNEKGQPLKSMQANAHLLTEMGRELTAYDDLASPVTNARNLLAAIAWLRDHGLQVESMQGKRKAKGQDTQVPSRDGWPPMGAVVYRSGGEEITLFSAFMNAQNETKVDKVRMAELDVQVSAFLDDVAQAIEEVQGPFAPESRHLSEFIGFMANQNGLYDTDDIQNFIAKINERTGFDRVVLQEAVNEVLPDDAQIEFHELNPESLALSTTDPDATTTADDSAESNTGAHMIRETEEMQLRRSLKGMRRERNKDEQQAVAWGKELEQELRGDQSVVALGGKVIKKLGETATRVLNRVSEAAKVTLVDRDGLKKLHEGLRARYSALVAEGNELNTKLEAAKKVAEGPAQASKPRKGVTVKTIISGGQTGGDMGGLQAGKRLGLKTGGRAPKGFRTDDGANPALKSEFGLEEDASSSYVPRTKANVDAADATIGFVWGRSAGTTNTLGYAQHGEWAPPRASFKGAPRKPNLTVTTKDPAKAAEQIKAFLEKHKPATLNIAGHRESSQPGINAFVEAALLQAMGENVEVSSAQIEAAKAEVEALSKQLKQHEAKEQALHGLLKDIGAALRGEQPAWIVYNRHNVSALDNRPIVFIDTERLKGPFQQLRALGHELGHAVMAFELESANQSRILETLKAEFDAVYEQWTDEMKRGMSKDVAFAEWFAEAFAEQVTQLEIGKIPFRELATEAKLPFKPLMEKLRSVWRSLRKEGLTEKFSSYMQALAFRRVGAIDDALKALSNVTQDEVALSHFQVVSRVLARPKAPKEGQPDLARRWDNYTPAQKKAFVRRLGQLGNDFGKTMKGAWRMFGQTTAGFLDSVGLTEEVRVHFFKQVNEKMRAVTIDTKIRSRKARFQAKIEGLAKLAGLKKVKVGPVLQKYDLSTPQAKAIAEAIVEGSIEGNDRALQALDPQFADQFRQLMDQFLMYQEAGGLLVRRRQGHSPLQLDMSKINENRAEALEAFRNVLQRLENREKGLSKAETVSIEKAEQWLDRIQSQEGFIDESKSAIEGDGTFGPGHPFAHARRLDRSMWRELAPYVSRDWVSALSIYNTRVTRRVEHQKVGGHRAEEFYITPAEWDDFRTRLYHAETSQQKAEIYEEITELKKLRDDARKKRTEELVGMGIRPDMLMQPTVKFLEAGRKAVREGRMSNEEYQHFADRVLPALTGTLGQGMHPRYRRMAHAVVAYQTVRLLAMSFFASIMDAGIAVHRAHDMKLASKAMSMSINKASKAEQLETLKAIGIIQDTVTEHMLNGSLMVGEYAVGKAQLIQESFFRLNFMHQWTQQMRLAAGIAGQLYLTKHARLAKGSGKEAAASRQALEDLGFGGEGQPSIDLILQFANPDGTLRLTEPAAQPLAHSVSMYVDESVLRPDAATRPWWGSHPIGAVFFFLKAFIYGFQMIVGQGILNDARRAGGPKLTGQAAQLFLKTAPLIATTLPLTVLGYELRRQIGSLGEKEWFDTVESDGVLGYFAEMAKRSGYLGVLEFAVEMEQDARRGGFLFSAVGGPAVEQASAFVGGGWNTRAWWANAVPPVPAIPVLRENLR